MSNNRKDIISFTEITSRLDWDTDLEVPLNDANPNWTMAKEWNKRASAMTYRNGRGESTTYRLPNGDLWQLLYNPVTGNFRVVWFEFGIDRMFIADGKPVTMIDGTDREGNPIRTITARADGAPGNLAGAWPMAMLDDLGRKAVADAAAAWASSQGRAIRYTGSGGTVSDGGFFPKLVTAVASISGHGCDPGIGQAPDEWTALVRDLSYWATLMAEATEGGFDPKQVSGDLASHLEDMGW